MRIVALTTCHNRRDKTLSALSDIFNQVLPKSATLAVCLVDDGSTDGTCEAVRKCFPEVQVIRGSGSLFWAGGMRYGWQVAVSGKPFDALLVFNDDIRLNKEALRQLIQVSHEVEAEHGPLHVVTGAFNDFEGKTITYGGFRRASRWHPLRFKHVAPTGIKQRVDTLNMNCSLIRVEVLCKIGFLAEYFQHTGADMEFGLRLRKAGGGIWLAPQPVGRCSRNGIMGTSKEEEISNFETWRRLVSKKEQPPLQRALYYKAHGGWYWPILWSGPYIRFIINIFRNLIK